MHLIAKIIRISRDKFHCNRLTAVLDIQGDASLIFLRHAVYLQYLLVHRTHCNQKRHLRDDISV